MPQFHGREHLNVPIWLRDLQKGNNQTLEAFNHRCWGYANENSLGIDYQAAFDVELKEDIEYQKQVIEEGLLLFETLCYKVDFFVPPNGPFNNILEETAKHGVKFMSAPLKFKKSHKARACTKQNSTG